MGLGERWARGLSLVLLGTVLAFGLACGGGGDGGDGGVQTDSEEGFYLMVPIAATHPYHISQTFYTPVDYLESGIHEGIDYDVAMGTPIVAAAPGTIYWPLRGDSGEILHGAVAVIHSDGWETHYGHMMGDYVLPVGFWVERGHIVGYGGDRRTSWPHLHFTLKKDGVVVDPDPHFRPRELCEYLGIWVGDDRKLNMSINHDMYLTGRWEDSPIGDWRFNGSGTVAGKQLDVRWNSGRGLHIRYESETTAILWIDDNMGAGVRITRH